jgi:NAD(P)-dependent dehydrogenase (short-subunit alcohol dehydrogenase family)
MDLHLKDRAVLVTGGAKGIGEAISRVLAAEGAVAIIIGRNRADNDAAVEKIASSGGKAFAIEAELTQTAECQKAVEAAMAKFGRIEGLVNNAGINDGVNLAHGERIQAWIPNEGEGAPFAQGTTVSVYFPVDALRVLPDAGTALSDEDDELVAS